MRLVSIEEVHARNASLAYWLSRPPAERIAEVERLRRECMERLRGTGPHGDSEELENLRESLNAPNVDNAWHYSFALPWLADSE